MNTTTLDLLELQISEPFTWLTNWLVAAFCLRFGHLLHYDKLADAAQKKWAMFFVFIAASAIIGGTAHGFTQYVGFYFHYIAWILTGGAIFCSQLAVLELIEKKKVYRIVYIFCYLQLLVFISAVLYSKSFNSVQINFAIGLLGVVVVFSLLHYAKYKDKRSKLIIIGICLNILPAAVHFYKISYNQWFNHNDISHILTIFSLYIIYKGAKQNKTIDNDKKKQQILKP